MINSRSAYLAAQTLASEAYGADPNAADKTIRSTDIQALAGVSGTLTGTITMTNLTSGGTASVVLSYTEDNTKYANYKGGQWEVATMKESGATDVKWVIATSTP